MVLLPHQIRHSLICIVLVALQLLPLDLPAEVLVVTGASSRLSSLSRNQVSDVFLGKVVSLPDGSSSILIDQPDSSPLREEFYMKVANKTAALAVELARRALRSGGWVGLLGASAKQGWLADGRIIALGSATLDEDDLLNALALHLGAWLAHPLYGMGLIARDRGDLTSGQAYVEASLKLLVTTDGGALPAQCYHFLGEVALLHAAHDVYRRVGDPRGVAGGAGCRAVASRGILGCASEAWKMVVALNPGVTARLRPRCRGGHV